ncbi:hypothetical protein HK104_008164 [Borealophlyctis nickersoniae]|nr:hypothetical protein HK104_008164 [Borealophlyctis nickersoniae]
MIRFWSAAASTPTPYRNDVYDIVHNPSTGRATLNDPAVVTTTTTTAAGIPEKVTLPSIVTDSFADRGFPVLQRTIIPSGINAGPVVLYTGGKWKPPGAAGGVCSGGEFYDDDDTGHQQQLVVEEIMDEDEDVGGVDGDEQEADADADAMDVDI